jgi:hypothetical protein
MLLAVHDAVKVNVCFASILNVDTGMKLGDRRQKFALYKLRVEHRQFIRRSGTVRENDVQVEAIFFEIILKCIPKK